jgi:hypothetical protein
LGPVKTAAGRRDLKVSGRDAQLILGQSRLAVTLEIYTHEDRGRTYG